jgi:hypothetical protein
LVNGTLDSEVCLSVRTPLKAEVSELESVRMAEAASKRQEKAIVDSTEEIYSAETKKYKERWADPFNKAIKDCKGRRGARGSSWAGWGGWGDDPFVHAMQMSVTDHWNDMYLAHAYPFLYARKIRYAFAAHFWELILLVYGKFNMYIYILIGLTLIIVGGYRTSANCDFFASTDSMLGIFATQVRPKVACPCTCR